MAKVETEIDKLFQMFYQLIACMEQPLEKYTVDSKLPVYIAMLNGNSAFDVVIHPNLIRRLFQFGISKQSILLLQNVYQNGNTSVIS
jgi:hypothetical protein